MTATRYFFFAAFLTAFLTGFFAVFLAATFLGLDLDLPFPALGPTR